MQAQSTENYIIKKDFFIKSRQEDIRKFYEFSPKVLGRGAYGVVCKARQLEAPYAYRVVKIIAKKRIKNLDSLQNEIEILRKLDHPMIIRLYETFEDQKNLYLIQDFCEGGELFERLAKNGNFNQKDAREIFSQIIRCIKYLHSQKISHRDLKPQNFLMNSKKTLQIKIIDFGLSYQWKQNMREELLKEKRNKLIGSSYYISPQVLKLDYDQRCDIWSAGVILYILVTATAPFDGENDRSIMENVKKLVYSFDPLESKRLSKDIKDLIKKILVPAQRRISISEIEDHPWMNSKLEEHPLQIDFRKLKNFANFSRLKALAVTFIAAQLPQKDIHELGLLFEQIDTNGDGLLTIQELQVALQKQHENPTYTQLKDMIDHIDTDRNGKINYNQFVTCCLETSFIQNEAYLGFVFRALDEDQTGKISKFQIKKVFEDSGIQRLSPTALEQIIEGCDKNGDGEIDYKQFLEAMGLKKG